MTRIERWNDPDPTRNNRLTLGALLQPPGRTARDRNGASGRPLALYTEDAAGQLQRQERTVSGWTGAGSAAITLP